jgi:kynurenine formamidase
MLMKIIDLTQSIYDGMDVYPGDPEVHIKEIHTLKKEGWRLKYLQFSSHIGTHVDAFSHMDESGKTVDKIPLKRFLGKTVIAEIGKPFPKHIGLAFREGKLGENLFSLLLRAEPSFVIVGNNAQLEVELERSLLKSGIITITDLVNMEKLPSNKPFMFCGVPLKIKEGDGSPIRAFAML